VAEGIIEVEDDLAGFVMGLVDFEWGLMGLAGGLGATERFEDPGICAIWPSKSTLGLIDRFDLRSIGSAMI